MNRPPMVNAWIRPKPNVRASAPCSGEGCDEPATHFLWLGDALMNPVERTRLCREHAQAKAKELKIPGPKTPMTP